MPLKTIDHPNNREPSFFTRDNVGWLPWLPPLEKEELTDRELTALVDRERSNSAYFTLLVRDPDILEARTRADKDIFYNIVDGLPRADREIAATAVSRVNGCIFCASVHARFAATYSKEAESVDLLLEKGANADLGSRWNTISSAVTALTKTPSKFGSEHIDRLYEAGLDDVSVYDVILSGAFFNWANRLMLSLGEASLPD